MTSKTNVAPSPLFSYDIVTLWGMNWGERSVYNMGQKLWLCYKAFYLYVKYIYI